MTSPAAALPGVTVVVTDVGRGVTSVRVSDTRGYFIFPTLPPGTYNMRLTLQGFQELVFETINAGPNAKSRFDVVMPAPAAVAETITVIAEAPAIERSEPAIKKTITHEELASLPIRGRDFQSVVDTLPGVTKTGSNFNINGSRDNQNIFLIDGARNNDLGDTSGRFRTSVYFIVNQQNPDDPSIGLDTGFHLQPLNQDAIQEIQVVSAAYSAEFGQGSGGVINLITRSGTDRWTGGFGFNFQDESLNSDDSFDDVRRTQESVYLGGPVSPGKAWFFTSYERDDNRTSFDLRRISYPGEPTGGKIRSFALDTGLPQSDTSNNRFTGKLTVQPANRNRLNLTFNYSSDTSIYNQAINRVSADQIEKRAGDNTTFSVQVNDFHTFDNNNYLYSLVKFSSVDRQSSSNLGPNGEQPIIWSAGPDGSLIFTDYYVIGQIGEVIDAQLKAFEWKESYSGFFGDHSMKFGFDWERFNENLLVPARDLFVSDNRTPDGTVIPVETLPAPPEVLTAFFATGFPVDQQLDATLNTYSGFVQDDWNVNPRWTVNLGLRYDYDDFLENHQISPRIHSIYALTEDGRFVLRAGAGVFRDRSSLLATEEASLVRSRGLNFDRETGEVVSGSNTVPSQNVFLQDGLSSPITYQGNIGLEYEIDRGYVAGANIIYKDFKDLIWTTIINRAPLTGPAPDPTIPANSKLIGNFGVMRDLIMELTFRKRFNGGFFNVNYTYEDTEGNSSRELAGRAESVIDSFAEAGDITTRRHSADYEVHHAFKVSGAVTLPYGIQFGSILKARTGRPWTPETRIALPRAHFIAPEGINARRLPREFQWDLRGAKSFSSGNTMVEVYLDVFNLTNYENVRSVQNIITSGGFGDPTSFLLPRTLQLGARVQF